jgi:hypothetical protein
MRYASDIREVDLELANQCLVVFTKYLPGCPGPA